MESSHAQLLFLRSGQDGHSLLGFEKVRAPSLEGLIDFFSIGFGGFAQFLQAAATDLADHLAYLNDELVIDFFERGPTAHHQIPDGDGELAGNGGYDQLYFAFAPQQLSAPQG